MMRWFRNGWWWALMLSAVVWMGDASAAPSVPVEERVILWTLDQTGQIVTSCDAPAIGAEWHLKGMDDLDDNGVPDLIWNKKVLSGNYVVVWMMQDTCTVAVAHTLVVYMDHEWEVVGLHDNRVAIRYLQDVP